MSKADGQYIAIKFTDPITSDCAVIYSADYQQITTGTLTVLNQYSAGEGVTKLNDGNTATDWAGISAINWINCQFSAAKVISAFKWYVGNVNYAPKTFTVSGSNNGTTFTQLSGTLTGVNTLGWQAFEFTNTTAYSHYRIDILTSYGSGYVFVYELQFRDKTIGLERAFTITGQEYSYVPGGTLVAGDYVVDSVEGYNGVNSDVDLSAGTLTNLTYDGALTLSEA